MGAEVRGAISVTLLTRNAGALLERVLAAVRAQVTSRRIEIIALDSESSDGTRATLERYGAEVASISAADFDFGRARDRVFEATTGDVIVSLSQDAVPAHSRWLENLAAPLSDPNIGVSCGRSIPDPDRDYRQFAWERNGYFYFTAEMRAFRRRFGRGLSNANAAYRRDAWDHVRFGPQPLGEDFRFQTRLERHGLSIAFPDDASVLHHHMYSMQQIYARCRGEGAGLALLDCPYTFTDLTRDCLRPAVVAMGLKELVRGNLRSLSELLFPLVRPVAVWTGSRSTRGCRGA